VGEYEIIDTAVNTIVKTSFVSFRAAHLSAIMAVSTLPAHAAASPAAKFDERDFTSLSLEALGSIRVPIVVGASKHAQKITDAPSAVSIVTREDIQQFGYRTLGDLLKSVRGFYVTYDRSYNFTGLRGVNRPGDFGGRVLINIDGHRLNDPIYDQAFSHTDFLVDLALVDRVEVIRGPGSSLYGNNAFFTVINVVTRQGSQVKGTEASASTGSFDTFTGRLSYGRKFSQHGVDVLLSGTWLDSRGHDQLSYPEFSDTNDGMAERQDGSTAGSAYLSISYGDFSLSGGYVNRRKNSPTASAGSMFNSPYTNRDVRAYGEFKYNHTFDHGWAIQARAYYDAYQYDGDFSYDYPPVTINRDRISARWGGAEAAASKRVWVRHRLTLGAEVRRDFSLAMKNFDVEPYESYIDASRTASSFAFYAQDEMRLSRKIDFNAGIRYDHFSTFGATVNPRASLVSQPWAGGTVKTLFGKAFRAPNAYELDYIAPNAKSNDDLDPETIQTYELVYEQALPGNLRTTASLFLNQIKGLIGQTIDPVDELNYFLNADQVEVHGVELEVEGRWARGLRARLSYTYADARDKLTDQVLDNSPRHLGKANLVIPLWREKIFAGLEFQATSSRRTSQGNLSGAHHLVNATLYSREIVRGVDLSANLYNVFDRAYSDPVSTDFLQEVIPQDGRTFQLKLSARF